MSASQVCASIIPYFLELPSNYRNKRDGVWRLSQKYSGRSVGLSQVEINGIQMSRYICIGMVSVVALLSGCGIYDCSILESTAKNESVRRYLKEWVDSRIASGDYTLSEREDLGKIRLPGAYAVNIPLDSKLIEMKEPEARPIVDTNGRAISFFFSGRLRIAE